MSLELQNQLQINIQNTLTEYPYPIFDINISKC